MEQGFVQGGAKVYISSRSAKACDEVYNSNVSRCAIRILNELNQVAAKLTALGPGKCIALPADLQNVEDIKKLVAELSKRETRMY